MAFQRLYPYTDASTVNLDWLINTVSKINIDEVQSVTEDVATLKTDVEALQTSTEDIATIRSNASYAKDMAYTADNKAESALDMATEALDDVADCIQKNGPATQLAYDNTESGLSATNVQAAIDALVNAGGGGGGQASSVLYNNTESGLSATNVQQAIDEVVTLFGKAFTGTLTAGETEISFTNDLINDDSTIDFYTSIYGINPVNAVISEHTLTLTFDAQENDVNVKVEVR